MSDLVNDSEDCFGELAKVIFTPISPYFSAVFKFVLC